MVLKKWDKLPDNMKNNNVRIYYDILKKKRLSLIAKRIFDVVLTIIALVIFFPIFIILSIAIKIDSKGPVFFCQIRVTQYGKLFKIIKFRTMIHNADRMGTQVTITNDKRVTKIGKFLRKVRLDEIPQLINILLGDMSFVGTRPEVVKYVEKYTDEMKATLLLPAGVTSKTSILYRDEELLLSNAEDVNETYLNKVLPAKMKYNLKSIEEFNFLGDISTMIRTLIAVIKKS